MIELCYQCSALHVVGAESITAEAEKKILSMYANNGIPFMCKICAIITTAREEADDLSITWGLYTWLPDPKKRTVEPSLCVTAPKTRKWAFGDFHCDFFRTASEALLVLQAQVGTPLIYPAGGYGNGFDPSPRVINIEKLKINEANFIESVRLGRIFGAAWAAPSEMFTGDGVINLDEQRALIAFAIFVIMSSLPTMAFVLELVSGSTGLVLRAVFVNRLLRLAALLHVKIIIDEALTYARAKINRDGPPGRANACLIESYTPERSIDTPGIIAVVAGKGSGCAILMRHGTPEQEFATTQPPVSEVDLLLLDICLHELLYNEVEIAQVYQDYYDAYNGGPVQITGVGMLMFTMASTVMVGKKRSRNSAQGGMDITNSNSSSTNNTQIPGRLLPCLYEFVASPDEKLMPSHWMRGKRLQVALIEANSLTTAYHLGEDCSPLPVAQDALIRRTLAQLIMDPDCGAGICTGASGLGAKGTYTPKTATNPAAWSNEWFNWMETGMMPKPKRIELGQHLEIDVIRPKTKGQTTAIRRFELSGFKGTSCGVVQRAELVSVCSLTGN